MQLISITEIKRPRWITQNKEYEKTKPTPTEARDLIKEHLYRRPYEEPAPDYDDDYARGLDHSPSDMYRTLRHHSHLYSRERRPIPNDMRRSEEPFNNDRRHDGWDVPNDRRRQEYRQGPSYYRNRRYARGGEFERNFRRSVGTVMRQHKYYEASMFAKKIY